MQQQSRRRRALSVLWLAAVGFSSVAGHSWLACTDYLEQNGNYWSASRCRGYARHAHQFTPKNDFGVDKGYDYQGTEAQPCRTLRNDKGAYNAQYPKAVYYPGQKVILAHPMKNHGADPRCTNKYIPDCGTWVYRGPVNGKTDLKLSEFKKNVVAYLGVSPFGYNVSDAEVKKYPKVGYQNAPKFCENMDRALATYTMKIPQNLAPGRYTFLWAWTFHCGEAAYTTCYEVDVVAGKASRDNQLMSAGLSTAEPGSD